MFKKFNNKKIETYVGPVDFECSLSEVNKTIKIMMGRYGKDAQLGVKLKSANAIGVTLEVELKFNSKHIKVKS